MPTVGISLVRPHTEHLRPPRALWVPFRLGRPLGAPGDPAFQLAVLRAALRLLERPSGPVLEDFPHDEPEPGAGVGDGEGDPAEGELLACPIPRRGGAAEPTVRERLAAEVAFLRPWYEEGRLRAGRTTVGVSGLEPEQAADLLADWLESADDAAVAAGELKLALDDLRAFCLEAAQAQPGAPVDPARLERWYWWETQVGRVLREALPRAEASALPELRMVGKVLMVPVGQRAF